MHIISELHKIGAIKYGHFNLQNGMETPVFVDFGNIISFPKLLEEAADLIWDKISHLHFDFICGAPSTARPIVTVIAYKHHIPMVMHRNRTVFGVFEKGKKCLVIEDVVTTGSRILDVVSDLEQAGFIVQDVCALVDREQGGKEALGSHGYAFHPILKLKDILPQ